MGPRKLGSSLTQRILRRLLQAESKETNRSREDDYRIARVTVALAADGWLQPQVAASYYVLGLHPDKVWPAIVARRKALLGRYYALFYPDLSLPPKKPARSEKVRSNEAKVAVGERRIDSLKSKRRGVLSPAPLVTLLEAPAMSSIPQTAYRNSDAATTEKNGRAFSSFRDQDIEQRIKYLPIKRGHRNTLLAWYEAAGRPTGKDVLLFCASEGVEMEAGISERTARYHRRALEKAGLVELVYSPMQRIRADYFRHTATWRLNLSALTAMSPRKSYKQHKAARPLAMPIRPQSVKHPTPATSTTAAPSDASSSTQPPSDPPKRDNGQRVLSLTRRQRAKLVQRIPIFINGRHGSVGTTDGGRRYIQPGDPDYIAPMSKPEAILAACKSMQRDEGVSLEAAIDAARDAGFVIEPKGSA
jgi:hypothetical protein